MSSPDQAPPPVPDDDDHSPEPAPLDSNPPAPTPDSPEPYQPNPALDDRVQAELTRKTEEAAAEYRSIAAAQARYAAKLVELQEWSEDPQVCARLHGNPENIRNADRNAATMTDDQARAAAFNRWDDREVARRTIVSEMSCLVNVAERTMERQIDEARFLYYYAPAAFEALAKGEISYRHATTLVDQLRTIPLEDQDAFEEAVLPSAKSQPVSRFRDKARRLREKLHPESIVIRTKNAFGERRTYWEAAEDGMGWLHWYGTADQTKAACDRISTMAISLKKAGDPMPDAGAAGSGAELPSRTLDQFRADVTAALLLDGITTTGLGVGIRGTVLVTVSAETLLGRSDEPAILEGYGPISPDAAREIAGNAPGFTRLLTHPETGVVLSLGKTQYKNTKAMKKWLRVRDETCRFPGCSRPAGKSDVDHTEEWQHGGTTDHDNLAHLCEPHHRLKHLSQWSVKQEPGGVLVWTSPGKRSYRTDPANPMAPPRPVPPTMGPRTRKRPADDTYLMPRHQPTRHPSPPVPENPPF